MRITQETDNAFRVLLHLAALEPGSRCTARIISQKMAISMQFTLKILNKLTRSGLTRAYRGVNGGYALNVPPSQISLKDVIEIIDGPIAINRCLVSPDFCSRGASEVCNVHKALREVQEMLVDKLDQIRLDTLPERGLGNCNTAANLIQ